MKSKINSFSVLCAQGFKYMVFCFVSLVLFTACKNDEDLLPPTISLIFESNTAHDGDTAAIGQPLRFKVQAEGLDANQIGRAHV